MSEDKTKKRESELESVEPRRVPIPAAGLGTRIEQTISRVGSKASAARAAGVSPESLRRYINESAMPPFDVMASLAATAGVDLHWLATGLGNAERAAADAVSGSIEDAPGDYAARRGIEAVFIRNAVRLVERRLGQDADLETKARLVADVAADLQKMHNEEWAKNSGD